MSNDLIYLDPERYIREEATRQIALNLDICAEIFIAQNASIHYSNIMPLSDAQLASKSSLLSWLRDYRRHNKVLRPGIITLYKLGNSGHFVHGKWQARNFVNFIEFMLKNLTDSRYIKNQSKVDQFLDSINDEEWLLQASSLAGVVLLEDLYRANALKSNVARSLLQNIFQSRYLLDSLGKIVGRVGKNNDKTRDWSREIKSLLQVQFRDQMTIALEVGKQESEYQLYKEHEKDIQEGLFFLKQELNREPALLLWSGDM